VRTRNGHSITPYLPELRPLPHRTRRPALTFVAFDLLWLAGHDLTGLPYEARRRFLVEIDVPAPSVIVNQFDGTDLDDVLAACEENGVEGVMLKRMDSTCQPGERCDTWRKVKCPNRRPHAERRRIGRPR